jgi:hypothetical protein
MRELENRGRLRDSEDIEEVRKRGGRTFDEKRV